MPLCTALGSRLRKFEANSIGWQRVLEHGDELRTAIADVIVAKTRELSVSDQYADEEVTSSYGYLSGYKPKRITEQTNILRQLFPGIGFADEKLAEQPLPPNAEGWFAIPKWQTLAPTYGEAVEKVLAMIGSKRKFNNYRDGQFGAQYLRQHAKTVEMFQKLGDEQKGHDLPTGQAGILIVACQFGLRHRGKSVRRAREIFEANEFGLDAFSVGIMLLTHPERLAHFDDLWIDCAGDDFAPDADGRFSSAPYFDFSSGHVEFDTYWVDDALDYYGSASGFCP
ncbi:MAG: hypothetical protein US74_C0012G0028 [Parcubacteria group bacterium GW2011_GWA2_38_13]|nr:MAG: hypothetical protein US74_C0012G0028 [Parcubacteria group bacterium GW2011_GWA2_38_13]